MQVKLILLITAAATLNFIGISNGLEIVKLQTPINQSSTADNNGMISKPSPQPEPGTNVGPSPSTAQKVTSDPDPESPINSHNVILNHPDLDSIFVIRDREPSKSARQENLFGPIFAPLTFFLSQLSPAATDEKAEEPAVIPAPAEEVAPFGPFGIFPIRLPSIASILGIEPERAAAKPASKPKPVGSNSKPKPVVSNSKPKPVVSNSKPKPVVSNSKPKPVVSNSKPKPKPKPKPETVPQSAPLAPKPEPKPETVPQLAPLAPNPVEASSSSEIDSNPEPEFQFQPLELFEVLSVSSTPLEPEPEPKPETVPQPAPLAPKQKPQPETVAQPAPLAPNPVEASSSSEIDSNPEPEFQSQPLELFEVLSVSSTPLELEPEPKPETVPQPAPLAPNPVEASSSSEIDSNPEPEFEPLETAPQPGQIAPNPVDASFSSEIDSDPEPEPEFQFQPLELFEVMSVSSIEIPISNPNPNPPTSNVRFPEIPEKSFPEFSVLADLGKPHMEPLLGLSAIFNKGNWSENVDVDVKPSRSPGQHVCDYACGSKGAGTLIASGCWCDCLIPKFMDNVPVLCLTGSASDDMGCAAYCGETYHSDFPSTLGSCFKGHCKCKCSPCDSNVFSFNKRIIGEYY